MREFVDVFPYTPPDGGGVKQREKARVFRISQALDSQTNSQKKKYNYKFNDLNPKAVSVDAAKLCVSMDHVQH